eukprot:2683655-Ditylum_brightwellii.AAC.1
MATKHNTINGSRRAAHKYWQGPQQTKAPRAPGRMYGRSGRGGRYQQQYPPYYRQGFNNNYGR